MGVGACIEKSLIKDGQPLDLTKRSSLLLLMIAVLGALTIALETGLLYMLPLSISAVLLSLSTTMGPVMGYIMFKHNLSAIEIIALVFSFAGILLLCHPKVTLRSDFVKQ